MDATRLAEIEARRDALKLQLEIIEASDVPSRVKNIRIKYITQELIAMKVEMAAAKLSTFFRRRIKQIQDDCTHGVAVVLHTGIGGECRCTKCDKKWESGDAYMQEMLAREKANEAQG